ncbi:DUF123 domain-containing protein, partial [Sphingobium olei]
RAVALPRRLHSRPFLQVGMSLTPCPNFRDHLNRGRDILEALLAMLGGDPIEHDRIESASVARGAYVLLICLDQAVPFRRGTMPHIFMPGWYVYAGSAYGPGGLRARIRRHLRRGKLLHWHIDHLTSTAAAIQAVAVEGGANARSWARSSARASLLLRSKASARRTAPVARPICCNHSLLIDV